MLLWASKFANAKIECSFKMGKWTPLIKGNIYFAGEKRTSVCKADVSQTALQ